MRLKHQLLLHEVRPTLQEHGALWTKLDGFVQGFQGGACTAVVVVVPLHTIHDDHTRVAAMQLAAVGSMLFIAKIIQTTSGDVAFLCLFRIVEGGSDKS
jgi:hypothetical protein